MKFLITQIDYDTDGEQVDLPAALVVTVPDSTHPEEVDEIISDEISNQTGFCHKGYVSEKFDGELKTLPVKMFNRQYPAMTMFDDDTGKDFTKGWVIFKLGKCYHHPTTSYYVGAVSAYYGKTVKAAVENYNGCRPLQWL